MDCGMYDEAFEDYELFEGDLDDSGSEFEVSKDLLSDVKRRKC